MVKTDHILHSITAQRLDKIKETEVIQNMFLNMVELRNQ